MIPAAELRAWVNADPADDPILEALEGAAVAHAQHVTGRHLGAPVSDTDILRGTGWKRLYLPDLPALVGSPGAYDVAVEYGDTGGDLAADTEWVLRLKGTEAWLERTDGGVWSRAYDYHVTYTRGFTAGEEPDDLRRYVVAFVSREWNMRGKEGLASEAIGGYSATVSRERWSYFDDMLAPWKRPVLA